MLFVQHLLRNLQLDLECLNLSYSYCVFLASKTASVPSGYSSLAVGQGSRGRVRWATNWELAVSGYKFLLII